MAISVKEFQRLKDRVDRLKTKAAEAKGELNGLMDRLKKEYNCDSLGDAQELLQEKSDLADEAHERFQKEYGEFQGKWGETLEGLG